MQKLILAVLVVNTLVAGGGAFLNYQVLNQSGASLASGLLPKAACTGPNCGQQDSDDYLFFPIEKIIVSLPENGREHYFVLDLVLQSSSDTDKKKLERVDPMVRNSVVAHLTSLSFSELRNKSIADLQQELDAAIQTDFQERQLAADFTHVLVSKLVVQ